MIIKYRDELGTIAETIDEYGVNFSVDLDGTLKAYFNDKKIDAKEVIEIIQGEL